MMLVPISLPDAENREPLASEKRRSGTVAQIVVYIVLQRASDQRRRPVSIRRGELRAAPTRSASQECSSFFIALLYRMIPGRPAALSDSQDVLDP